MKQTLSRKTISMLRKVQKAIRKHPELYAQNEPEIPRHRKFGKQCGCIFGFALKIANGGRPYYLPTHKVYLDGAEALGLPTSYGNWTHGRGASTPAARLFTASNWPAGFETINSYVTPEEAIRRIDVFIESGGRR